MSLALIVSQVTGSLTLQLYVMSRSPGIVETFQFGTE